MSDVWIPLIAGFVGVLMGSAVSIAVAIIQAKSATVRERLRVAAEAAIQDRKAAIELAKTSGLDTALYPLGLYMHYHFEVLKLVSKGQFKADTLVKLIAEQRKIQAILRREYPPPGR